MLAICWHTSNKWVSVGPETWQWARWVVLAPTFWELQKIQSIQLWGGTGQLGEDSAPGHDADSSFPELVIQHKGRETEQEVTRWKPQPFITWSWRGPNHPYANYCWSHTGVNIRAIWDADCHWHKNDHVERQLCPQWLGKENYSNKKHFSSLRLAETLSRIVSVTDHKVGKQVCFPMSWKCTLRHDLQSPLIWCHHV